MQDVPLESLQQSASTVTDISQCPEKTDACCLESQKDIHGLSAQNEKVDIVNQTKENTSTEAAATEVTLNVNTEQNDEQDAVIETKNDAVLEATTCVMEILEEASNKQNSFQEANLNSVAGNSECVQENVVELEESTPNHNISDDCHVSQTQKESVVGICYVEEGSITESHTVLAETKGEHESKSVATTTVNEGEAELNNQECPPNTIINGEMPTLIINQTLTYDKELSENKNIPVSTVTAGSNVFGCGAVEQMPVKVAGVETKKARVSSSAFCLEQQ
jgi:hypothetical protein